MKYTNIKRILLCLALLSVGFATGRFIKINELGANSLGEKESIALREKGNFKFIQPLLLCGASDNEEAEGLQPMKEHVATYIDRKIQKKSAIQVSVYFRDILSGQWFGINENEKYTPASLLKIPIMIAFLKMAETQPALLSEEIFYDGGFDSNSVEEFQPNKKILPGNSYTIETLIKMMISYSDNNALALLSSHVDQHVLDEVYTDLGIEIPPESAVAKFMSAKVFSQFFRILYNSSYLNREMSEKALQFLNDADFEHGITAGIPDDINVAQKFGERTRYTENGEIRRALHNCGIVYYPEQPYVLCIMTRGTDFDELSEIIERISAMIFRWKRYKE